MSNEVTDLTRGVYRRQYAGFIKGQRINKLTLEAEAWFWRVMASVDDFGNGDADPELCRAATAGKRPVTTQQVSTWLGEMRSAGLIQFYIVKGEPYLHIVGFEVSQPAGKNGRRIRRFPSPDESEGIQVIPDAVSASYSEDDNDTEDDNEKKVRAAKPRSPNTCDSDFLDDLQTREAYKNLNVRLVLSKMEVWCEQRKKLPTRARLINWLNREDQPMENGNGSNRQGNGHQAVNERRAASFGKLLSVVEELRDEGGGAAGETVRRKSLTS